jgi:hypothetical protein
MSVQFTVFRLLKSVPCAKALQHRQTDSFSMGNSVRVELAEVWRKDPRERTSNPGNDASKTSSKSRTLQESRLRPRAFCRKHMSGSFTENYNLIYVCVRFCAPRSTGRRERRGVLVRSIFRMSSRVDAPRLSRANGLSLSTNGRLLLCLCFMRFREAICQPIFFHPAGWRILRFCTVICNIAWRHGCILQMLAIPAPRFVHISLIGIRLA